MSSLEDIVYPAVDAINGVLPAGEKLAKEPSSVCFGLDAALDSISLLRLIAVVEERFRDVTGRAISLMDADVIAMRDSPFRTLGSLASYLDSLCSEPVR